MKLSIICCFTEEMQQNQETLNFLTEELKRSRDEIQIIAAKNDNDFSALASALDGLQSAYTSVSYLEQTWACDAACYNLAAPYVEGDYVTVLHGGDRYETGTLQKVIHYITEDGTEPFYLIPKRMANNKPGAFRAYRAMFRTEELADVILPALIHIDLVEYYRCYPFYMGGTFMRTSILKENSFREDLPWDAERDFLLRVLARKMKLAFINDACTYYCWEYEEKNETFFKGMYDRSWYYDSITDFWLPFLEEMTYTYGRVPNFIQYHLMYSMVARFNGNLNNKNKHIVEEGKGEEYLELLARTFRYIDDDILMNRDKIEECKIRNSIVWVFGIMKHGKDFKFSVFPSEEEPERMAYGAYGVQKGFVDKLQINISFLNYRDGNMEIDGSIPAILYSIADEIVMKSNGKTYPLVYNERYAHTKVFGTAIFKSQAFHVSVPVDEKKGTSIYTEIRFGKEKYKQEWTFPSHFSRISKTFRYSYWCFGEDNKLMASYRDKQMQIRTVTRSERIMQELKYQANIIVSRKLQGLKYAFLRTMYFLRKKRMTKYPVWMYIDKIYKGGDSSEYLYRYALTQPEKIRHYYLVDKKCTDYKRLKKAGYKPLVKGTLLHKLVFLYADMMVISNSTVFAFNGYALANSVLIRDLVHFHVCCVQHGMSVQKIAIAQNRLRDNTRLYFCASKYEIENLSRPVYDYVGYDALKLTGVPRYDGLHDRAGKQIMISPTWRMQAAVPVRTNEGEQRDYNPLFKETTYYKVFNALINDSRLTSAAKEYGYKIKYVLHPIVSSQVDDFDRNPYVDIVPAVGDMSYEDMFCESSLMVTDFSGIQYDFAYMRKPLVYLHHKDIPQHYEEGSFHYDTMAFGEICHDNDELIDVLIAYMKNGCVMKDVYRQRADDFFYYRDDKNCERIYKEMLTYQNENVLPFRY